MVVVSIAGCGSDVSVIDGHDGGGASEDGGVMRDAAPLGDAGTFDAAPLGDAGTFDAETVGDAGAVDASGEDAGTPTPDAGTPDGGPSPRPVAVSAGGVHTCALFDDGRVLCWGDNDEGALGVSGSGILPPTEVPGIRATAIAAGGTFTCAIVPSSSGSGVQCWGRVSPGVMYAGPTMVPGLGVSTNAQADRVRDGQTDPRWPR
jgi:hypothetical protein